jgi:hypothetical protein
LAIRAEAELKWALKKFGSHQAGNRAVNSNSLSLVERKTELKREEGEMVQQQKADLSFAEFCMLLTQLVESNTMRLSARRYSAGIVRSARLSSDQLVTVVYRVCLRLSVSRTIVLGLSSTQLSRVHALNVVGAAVHALRHCDGALKLRDS